MLRGGKCMRSNWKDLLNDNTMYILNKWSNQVANVIQKLRLVFLLFFISGIIKIRSNNLLQIWTQMYNIYAL